MNSDRCTAQITHDYSDYSNDSVMGFVGVSILRDHAALSVTWPALFKTINYLIARARIVVSCVSSFFVCVHRVPLFRS